ncbi:MAG: PadR family transcriptional regulator [Chloroflexi bacterium]|nr:PadR family transcriptional regulator [Chloroflexota bacterium]
MQDVILRDFFVGFIRLHILYHASKEPVFGLSLIRELARHGYSLSPGTLYPVLHRLEANGFLSSERAVINGRWRRYYRITEEGSRALSQAREKVTELVTELNE